MRNSLLTSILLLLGLALGLAFGLAFGLQAQGPGPNREKVPPETPKTEVINKLCPVTGKPVKAGVSLVHEGKTIGFSGVKSRDLFAKEPKQYQVKLDRILADAKKAREAENSKEEDLPLPGGTDPADIAAMRSARAMIKAEKKLAGMIKAGKIKGIDRILPFEEIASWPYEDGLKGMPKKLWKLDGKTVMMTGFMLPIDEVENIKEFLLVQSLWSCCYGQPPDINGTVRVVMKGKKRIDYKFEPIKVVGQFKIAATTEDGFCVDIYQLQSDSVEIIN